MRTPCAVESVLKGESLICPPPRDKVTKPNLITSILRHLRNPQSLQRGLTPSYTRTIYAGVHILEEGGRKYSLWDVVSQSGLLLLKRVCVTSASGGTPLFLFSLLPSSRSDLSVSIFSTI